MLDLSHSDLIYRIKKENVSLAQGFISLVPILLLVWSKHTLSGVIVLYDSVRYGTSVLLLVFVDAKTLF